MSAPATANAHSFLAFAWSVGFLASTEPGPAANAVSDHLPILMRQEWCHKARTVLRHRGSLD